MREAWKRLVLEAASWNKNRGSARSFFREMKDLGKTCPSWQVLAELRHDKDVAWQRWAKKHEIGPLEEGIGLDQSKPCVKGGPIESGRRGMREREDCRSSMEKGRKRGFMT